jgi:hypothetical protein
MSGEAIKFLDLEAFWAYMDSKGWGPQARSLIYENSQLPYCSAYILPTKLLPPGFEPCKSNQFGGCLIDFEEIVYTGDEKFYTDFMIYPASGRGYLEVSNDPDHSPEISEAEDEQELELMSYVINIEDGGGQEFFQTASGRLVNLTTDSEEVPQEFSNYKLVSRKIDQIRDKYPASCHVYALEKSEFEERRRVLQLSQEDKATANSE